MINKNRRVLLLILTGSLIASSGCGKDSAKEIADSTQVVARVNDRDITISYVERRISNMSPVIRKALNNKDGQKEFIDSLTSRELILQAAKKEGLDKNHAILTQIEDYKNDLLVQAMLQKKLESSRPNVTKEEIQKFYDENKDNFTAQTEMRLSHIFVQNEKDAKDILSRIESGEEFAKLAYEKSASRPTAMRGGDMGYVRKWQLPANVADQIFTLEIGQHTGVIPSDFGFTIVKVTDKREGPDVAVELVSDAIKAKLFKDKQRKISTDYIDGLKKNAKITMNESVLASLKFSQD